MKELLLGLARRLIRIPVKEYYCFKIYCLDTDASIEPAPQSGWIARRVSNNDLRTAADGRIRELASYDGKESWSFAVEADQQLVSALWILAGNTYKRLRRDFWPMKDGEAELASLITTEAARGRGIAPFLISYSACRMKELGFRRLFARIWHSNRASIGAFRKAGWQYCATVIEVDIRAIRRPLRIVRKVRRKPGS